MIDIGPQYSEDDPFTARMRIHQSWYRTHVLRVECGVGPQRTDTERYGSMLCTEDGARGLNFLTAEIATYARARQAEFPSGIKAHRLSCNMLSSQPMCFNLFAPLALDRGIAPAMISALVDADVAGVEKVVIEYAPRPKSDYLDDATSFDAYVEYSQADSSCALLGIETKLTEPFSRTRYPASKASYARWIEQSNAPWLPSARKHLDARSHNQLWRDHMLGFACAARTAANAGVRWSVALVRHPLDEKCRTALETYRQCLRPDDKTLLDLPLDTVVERLRPVVRTTRWAEWLRDFERRYLDLKESEQLAGEQHRRR